MDNNNFSTIALLLFTLGIIGFLFFLFYFVSPAFVPPAYAPIF